MFVLARKLPVQLITALFICLIHRLPHLRKVKSNYLGNRTRGPMCTLKLPSSKTWHQTQVLTSKAALLWSPSGFAPLLLGSLSHKDFQWSNLLTWSFIRTVVLCSKTFVGEQVKEKTVCMWYTKRAISSMRWDVCGIRMCSPMLVLPVHWIHVLNLFFEFEISSSASGI